MATQSAQLQDLSTEYQQLQKDLQENVLARQRLEAQEQENMNVRREFSTLGSDARIYKMTGPVLLRQDHPEAGMAVEGRLDFIGKEIKRVEGSIKDIQDRSEIKKAEIFQMQSSLQESNQASVVSREP